MMAKKASRPASLQLLIFVMALATALVMIPAAIEAVDQDEFKQSADEFFAVNECGQNEADMNIRRELAVTGLPLPRRIPPPPPKRKPPPPPKRKPRPPLKRKTPPPPKRKPRPPLKRKPPPPPKRKPPPPPKRMPPPPPKPKSPPPPKPKSPPPPKPKSPPPPKPKSPPPPKPKSPPPPVKAPPPPKLVPKPPPPPPPPSKASPTPPVVVVSPLPPPLVATPAPPPPVFYSPPPPVFYSPPPPPVVVASPPPPPPIVASPPPPPPLVLGSPPPPLVVASPPPPPQLATPPPTPPPPPNPYPTSSKCPVLGTAVYPPAKLARWDKHYWNKWTPSDPPGGLVVSDDQLHAELKITTKNQIFGGFLSQKRFVYGFYDIWIKVIPNHSAGLIMAYYLTSPENYTLDSHDEIDFEFLGNVSGQPVTLQTNVHVNGKGNREVRHSLPFDPTADFHKYSLLWNQHVIIWYVDDSVIRVHHNKPDVPFPTWRPMAVITSLWNGSVWATRGGQDKLDLAFQPFILQFEGFDGIESCAVCTSNFWRDPNPDCPMAPNSSYVDSCSTGNWWNEQTTLTTNQWQQLQCHEQNYVIYHYCFDENRHKNKSTGVVIMPPECKYNELDYNYPPK